MADFFDKFIDDTYEDVVTLGPGNELQDARGNGGVCAENLTINNPNRAAGSNLTHFLNQNKLNTSDVIDALNSSEAEKALSANQGRILNEAKINYTDIINNLTAGGASVPLSAEQGKVLNETKADVETGIWTPVDNSGGGLSFIVSNAQYLKIDDLYSVTLVFTFPINSDSNLVDISGLPAPTIGSSSQNYMFSKAIPIVGSIGDDVSGYRLALRGGQSRIFIKNSTGFLDNQHFSGKEIRVSFIYLGV